MRSHSRKRPPVPCSAQDLPSRYLENDSKRRKLPYSAPTAPLCDKDNLSHVLFPESDLSEGSRLPPPYSFDPPPWSAQAEHTRSLEEPNRSPQRNADLRKGIQSDPPGYECRPPAGREEACSPVEEVPAVVGSRRRSSSGFEAADPSQWSVLDYLRRMTCEQESMMDEWCQLDSKVRAFQRSFTELYQCKEMLLHRIESLMKQTKYAVSALTPPCNRHHHAVYMPSQLDHDEPDTMAPGFSPHPSPYSVTFWASQDVPRPLPVSPAALPVQAPAMIEEEEASRPEPSFCEDEEAGEYENAPVSSQEDESTSDEEDSGHRTETSLHDERAVYGQETTSSEDADDDEEEEEEEEELDLGDRVPTTGRCMRDGGKAPAKFPVRRPASKSLMRAGSASDDAEGAGGDTQDEDALDAISSDFPQDDCSVSGVSLKEWAKH